ncbi:MAG: BON domain-containing protein [Gammaproteobacteria bacterium]
MLQPNEMVSAVRVALERYPEVNFHDSSIELAVHDGVLIMTGEVPDIIARRVAHLAVVQVLGMERVQDELRVTPAVRHSDAEIARFLERLLMQESAFRDYQNLVIAGASVQQAGTGNEPRDQAIRASVRDAVVTLEGAVGSLTHRRLADVLAWWTPGVCGVRNFLHVTPDELDTDAEVTDALRIILEKRPSLDAAAIEIRVKDRRVTLDGVVASEAQRRMAGESAWYVLGVHGVNNRLQVRLPQAP